MVLTVSGRTKTKPRSATAATMNMIQKLKRHPRCDIETQPPIIGPTTALQMIDLCQDREALEVSVLTWAEKWCTGI